MIALNKRGEDMVNKVHKLQNDFKKADEKFSDGLRSLREDVDEVSEQVSKKIDNIANVDSLIKDIDIEFAQKTGIINKKDQVLLWTAVALQTIRWWILPKIKIDMPIPDMESRVNADTAEEKKILDLKLKQLKDEDAENLGNDVDVLEKSSKFIDKYTYFAKPVPYDAMNGEEAKKLNLPGVKKNPDSQLSGKTHHAATLGHDPVLGYFFGTMNIMTYTITFHKIDLQTNEVILIGDTWNKEIGSRVSFCRTLMTAMAAEIDDMLRIPFAVARHQIHLMTDENTKMGLPIPFLSASKQQSLLEKGWNSEELKKIKKSFLRYRRENQTTVAIQFMIAAIINIIIKSMHLLMYDDLKDESFELYCVRTSKIIRTSSIISESINLAYVGGNVAGGIFVENPDLVKKGIENLDIGGYLECVHQIVANKKIQERIRREFLEKQLESKLIGENYSFMEEANE